MLELLVSFRVGVERTGGERRAEAIERRVPVRLRAPPHQLHKPLLVEVEEEAVVGERRGRAGPEEREGRVDVSQLDRAARAADEETRPVGRGRGQRRRGWRRGGDGGSRGG